MSDRRHTARWLSATISPTTVLVAEDARAGLVGLTSLGSARDRNLGFEGEVYTLYVDPAFLGRGTGRAELAGAFDTLKDRKLRSCVIWRMHATMPASSTRRWAGGGSPPAPHG